jgi:hypothetical protein
MLNQLDRIKIIDSLIQHKATGAPAALAEKLGVSESSIYRLIRVMKEDMELSVTFSDSLQSYIYSDEDDAVLVKNLLTLLKK